MKVGSSFHSESDIEGIKFFIGTNPENTLVSGVKTLYVIGEPDIEEISRALAQHSDKNIGHIQFGAERSFVVTTYQDAEEEWIPTIKHFLTLDYWCTLEFDVSLVNLIHETKLAMWNRFIPVVSVKIPFIDQLGYNSVIKLDDVQFNSSNVGVWNHQIHNLMDYANYTSWDDYKDDLIVNLDESYRN